MERDMDAPTVRRDDDGDRAGVATAEETHDPSGCLGRCWRESAGRIARD
jgi:hypothetical protein